MIHGFLKVAAAVPGVTVANCQTNTQRILEQCQSAAAAGVKILVFPELCLTGASCGDLFRSPVLLQESLKALQELRTKTRKMDMLIAVGLPVRSMNSIYNCCALIHRGDLLGIAGKQTPSGSQTRWFTACETEIPVSLPGEEDPVMIQPELLLDIPALQDAVIGVEIGSDADGVVPLSSRLVSESGAILILHPDASPETVHTEGLREQFLKAHTRRLCCTYIHAQAGPEESTGDQVFGGSRILCENGTILASGSLLTQGITISETDLDLLLQQRISRQFPQTDVFDLPELSLDTEQTLLTRQISRTPFLPDPETKEKDLKRILDLQSAALAKRIRHVHARCCVIGLSGGLDSTLALLASAAACDRIGRPREDILAVTMPCFGTSVRTRTNAEQLAEALGVRFQEIPITRAVEQHFLDIGQPKDCHDVTFENAQARERTQVLMDLANRNGGLVIGTGDLSELALGWATYNGDHMSMYSINAGIPKTAMRSLIEYLARKTDNEPLREVLTDILETPVSPELLPTEEGQMSQITEDLIGPYALHDFFLYHALYHHFTPSKIQRLAELAFAGEYDSRTILKWNRNFFRRFFQQQFKRSCLPDGPALTEISFSPRGGLMMPSDSDGSLWLQDISFPQDE